MTTRSERFHVMHSSQLAPEVAARTYYSEPCWVVLDTKIGEVVGEDGGEPEDQLLVRDWEWVPNALNAVAAEGAAALEKMRARKDAAYTERNQCVALMARMALELGWRAGRTRTAIEGWSDDWHGCVYIDLPTGQVSWHFHDDHAPFFDSLPEMETEWDGHTTPQKYERVNNCLQNTRTA